MTERVRHALRDLITFENRGLMQSPVDDQITALLKKLDNVPGRKVEK